MHIYVDTYKVIYWFMYTCIYIYIYIYICVYINIHIHIYLYHHYVYICVYTYTLFLWRHYVYYTDMCLFHNACSTTHVMFDMLVNMPGASDWMPFWFRYRAPEVVEHIPTDDTWKAASSDKMQLPNVAICVSAPTRETHTQMKTRSVCMMRILTQCRDLLVWGCMCSVSIFWEAFQDNFPSL